MTDLQMPEEIVKEVLKTIKTDLPVNFLYNILAELALLMFMFLNIAILYTAISYFLPSLVALSVTSVFILVIFVKYLRKVFKRAWEN